MVSIVLFQNPITRIILVYVIQGIMLIFFSSLAYQIVRRRRQRLNLIFSGFFISMIIAFILNMIYFVINVEYEEIVIFLHFLSWFFVTFGLIFILIVNMIILESTIIFSVKRQNRYILLFGLLHFFGMLIILLVSNGVSINPQGYPVWKLQFFIYMASIVTVFEIIPIIYTMWKIYISFETKELKRRWLYYLIGSLGLIICNLYSIMISHLLNIAEFRDFIMILGVSVLLWVSLMYYGIGAKLKK